MSADGIEQKVIQQKFFEPSVIPCELKEIVPAAGIPLMDAWNILQTRRDFMERISAHEEAIAHVQKAKAEVWVCNERLQTDTALKATERAMVDGQRQEALARWHRWEREIEQLQMEMSVIYQQLGGGEA